MDFNAWYQSTYPFLSGYGLWLRGNELNTIPPEQWEARPFRVLISRLSTFRDTADSFTHTLLYQIAGSQRGIYPDLAWLPPPKDAALFDRDGVPWLLGATSKRPAREFTMVALSLSIVQELANIPVILKKSGIPLSHKERMADSACPLLILGGSSALYTSSLFSDDPLVDGIFIGEDAKSIAELLALCRDALSSGASRSDALEHLCRIPGFFIPKSRPRVTVSHVPSIDAGQLLTNGPVLTCGETIGIGHLQISEGCACFCSFCAESFSRKPYRELPLAGVQKAALEAKRNMGVDDLDLYSFNFNMHRDLYAMLDALVPLFPNIGLKSQRFDSIAHDPPLLDALHALNKTSLTCGLEGISPRLRRYLHKSIDEQDLAKALREILRAKVRELKVFLIATGLESDEDFTAFKAFVASLRSAMQTTGRSPRLIFSMTPLVRFPATPLEFEDAPGPAVMSAIMGRCGHIVRNGGFEFRTSADVNEYWLSQVLVRAPDGRIGDALSRAREATGFIYYREVDERFVKAFSGELERSGFRAAELLAGSVPGDRSTKPWGAIDTGVGGEFLERQWRAARAFEDRGFCAGTAKREGSCLACDACSTEAMRRSIQAKPKSASVVVREFCEKVALCRDRERLLPFYVDVHRKAAGLPRKIVGVALARALMLAIEEVIEGYRGYRGSLIRETWDSDWIVGDDRISLAWDVSSMPALEKAFADQALLARIDAEMNGYGSVIAVGRDAQATKETLVFRSLYRFDPDRYCKANGLKSTLLNTDKGAYRYDFSKESLKKKIIEEMSVAQSEREWTVTVRPGPKFRAEKFVKDVFELPYQEAWVTVAVCAVFAD